MENTTNNEKKPEFDMWKVINFGFEMGFIIALPLLSFGFLGKWLDGKYGTKPGFSLTGVLLAITFTTIWLSRKFKEMINRL